MKEKTSKYKGVRLHSRRMNGEPIYETQYKKNRINHYVGTYETEEQAAFAWDLMKLIDSLAPQQKLIFDDEELNFDWQDMPHRYRRIIKKQRIKHRNELKGK